MTYKQLKIVIAAMIGHALEFFDFTIYAVFAAELGMAFFPSSSEFAQLLSSLMVLAIGFFMRPLGGIVFGHIGDRYGRQLALTISVIGMAAATIGIAFLPTFASIGILAPLLLVSLRLVQGLCVGGEGAGASIFVLEHLHKMRPGLIGGIVNSALTVGILMAVGTGLVLHKLFPGDAELWRGAFMIGGLVGLAGIYIRLNIEETPVFEELKATHRIVRSPLKAAFTGNLKNVVLTIAVGGLTGCSGYLVMTFIDIFYKSVMHFEPSESLTIAMYGNVLLIVFLPLMGSVSDKIGYARTICFGALFAIMLAMPIFMMMGNDNMVIRYIAVALLSGIVALIYAPLYPFMMGLFSAEQRYSGIACSLNIGIALFGGTAPLFCLTLVKVTALSYAPAFYWIFTCFVFLSAVGLLRPRIIFGAILRTPALSSLSTLR